MRKTLRKKAVRDSAATYASLLDAAEIEFNTRGFDGTDSNRIARAAGFAPQTFYRHFEDKRAAFLAVYERWWKGEVAALQKAGGGELPGGEAAARVALAFHTKWRGFRRALRHLAIVDPRVRAARTAARRSQIARIGELTPQVTRSDGELAAALLKTERLCDAVAEGELADLGISPNSAKALVRAAIKELLGSSS
ncbi:MAG TPA: TetR/AcrR family transcriptional regulator [Steroidobacteraceae bacterium]